MSLLRATPGDRPSAPLLAILPLALGLLAWPPAAAAQDGTASLVGTVSSVGSDTAVEGVEVVLVEEDRTAVSDADGRFRFAELAPGSHALEIRHGEATSRRLTVELRAGTVTDLSVRIQGDPVPVGDLQVQVEGARRPGKLAGFYRRQAASPGLFLEGEELARAGGGGTLTDALREQPGLGVSRCVSGGGPVAERDRRSGSSFGVRPEDEEDPTRAGDQGYGERERERAGDARRRAGGDGMGPDRDAPGRERHFIPGCQEIRIDRSGSREDCRPRIYLDGASLPTNDPDMLRRLGGLDTRLLAGVEVYRGPSEVPPEYRSRDGCGVILLWTREGARVAG